MPIVWRSDDRSQAIAIDSESEDEYDSDSDVPHTMHAVVALDGVTPRLATLRYRANPSGRDEDDGEQSGGSDDEEDCILFTVSVMIARRRNVWPMRNHKNDRMAAMDEARLTHLTATDDIACVPTFRVSRALVKATSSGARET